MRETLVDGTDLVSISEAARALGVHPNTIRFYEETGLIPEAHRNSAGYRRYDQADLDRLAFIRRARRLNISLNDIREILGDAASSRYVTRPIDKRISDIDAKIEVLNQLRHELEEIWGEAKSLPR